MAIRAVVLLDEFDNKLGSVSVPESIQVIKHKDCLYVRTDKGVRLSGGGIGVAFIPTEVYVRDKLAPV